MIVKIAEGTLKTKYGDYQEYLFYDGQKEIIALVMGELRGANDVLCRVHSSCIAAHHFNSIECDCREEMEISQQMIQAAGRGIVIWLDQEGKANGHFALLKSKPLLREGLTQTEAYEAAGFKRDARDFTRAAEILHELGVVSIQMLTNNPKKIENLTRLGIQVAGIQPIHVDAGDNHTLRQTLEGKKKEGHLL
jgi:GTP cyclohydrolase II